MLHTRRKIIGAGGLAALALAVSATFAPAAAQKFTGPVHIIVPAAPGGSSDLLARLIAPGISKAIGQTVVVENKPGAANNIGLGYVANSKPDAHTLVLVDVGAIAISVNLFKDLPYKLTDLAPITMVTFTPYVLGINPKLPAKDAKSFVEYAQSNPINAGSSGSGSLTHLTSVMLTNHWKAKDAKQVPYKGISAAITGVVSGEATMVVSGTDAIKSFVDSGQLIGVAVSGKERLPWVKDAPTFAELGWPMEEMGSWQGILAPANSPPELIDALHKAVAEAVQDPDVKARILDRGAGLVVNGPAHLQEWLNRESKALGERIKEAGVSAP